MMIIEDLPGSFVAWISVVLIQYIVHYSIVSRTRKNEGNNDDDFMFVPSLEQISGGGSEHIKNNNKNNEDADCGGELVSLIDSDLEDMLDGDEPENFMVLLSQTGSEMMKNTNSMENLVLEQMQQ